MMRVTDNPKEIGRCGCGRSPTGQCIGWHALNDTQLAEAQRQWDLEQYRRQAMDQFFEDGSCTGGWGEVKDE